MSKLKEHERIIVLIKSYKIYDRFKIPRSKDDITTSPFPRFLFNL